MEFLVYSDKNIIYFLDLEKNEEVARLKYYESIDFRKLSLSENGEYLLVTYRNQIDLYSLKNLYN
jgi:hypothetical protein